MQEFQAQYPFYILNGVFFDEYVKEPSFFPQPYFLIPMIVQPDVVDQ